MLEIEFAPAGTAALVAGQVSPRGPGDTIAAQRLNDTGNEIQYHPRMAAAPSRPRSRKPTVSRQKPASAPAMLALQHFRLIFKSVKKHFHWVEQQTGVSGAQLWALSATVEQPAITVSELAKALAIHQSTASNLVDKLVKQGLLRRQRNDEDQRVVHLYAEPKGIRLIKSAPKPLQGVLPDALSRLSASDVNELNALLAKLVREMKVRDSRGKTTPLADI